MRTSTLVPSDVPEAFDFAAWYAEATKAGLEPRALVHSNCDPIGVTLLGSCRDSSRKEPIQSAMQAHAIVIFAELRSRPGHTMKWVPEEVTP